jgi:hypothetical protein
LALRHFSFAILRVKVYLVTGGVVSSVGKGIIVVSMGAILKIHQIAELLSRGGRKNSWLFSSPELTDALRFYHYLSWFNIDNRIQNRDLVSDVKVV